MTQSKKNETWINLDELDMTLTDTSASTITVSTPDYDIGDIYVDSHTMDSYTIDTTNIFTSDTIDLGNLTFNHVVFEDYMPNPQTLKRMCEEYPALEKVYKNFKTVYSMVEQDWKGNNDDDEELPF